MYNEGYMADSPDIKILKQREKLNDSLNLDTTSGIKRDKKVKRSKWQRKFNASKRSLKRKIFSSKKEYNPEKDNILNLIIDGIADKIGDIVDSALETQPQQNPLQELEELHPPKIPNLEELAEELSKQETGDDDSDNKKDTDYDGESDKEKLSDKNKIRL